MDFGGGKCSTRRKGEDASMFLKVGRKIVNTDNLVDADVYEPGEALSPYRKGWQALDADFIGDKPRQLIGDRVYSLGTSKGGFKE